MSRLWPKYPDSGGRRFNDIFDVVFALVLAAKRRESGWYRDKKVTCND